MKHLSTFDPDQRVIINDINATAKGYKRLALMLPNRRMCFRITVTYELHSLRIYNCPFSFLHSQCFCYQYLDTYD